MLVRLVCKFGLCAAFWGATNLLVTPAVQAATPTYPAAYVNNPVSYWNRQVDSQATYSSIPLVTLGLDNQSDWAIPFYVASTTDPVTPAKLMPLLYSSKAWTGVASGRWARAGNSPEIEAEILASSTTDFPWPGNPASSLSTTSWVLPASFHQNHTNSGQHNAFYYSTQMAPALGSDGHMAVLQPNGMVIETYATIVLSSGQVVAGSYALTNPAGLCDGYQDGQTAAMLPVYAGVVDDQEVIAGEIKHAIAVVLPAKLLAPSARYPAYAFDRSALTQSPYYSGIVPMGARLAIPRSVDITKLGLTTREGMVFAVAAQKFGFIGASRGGSGIAIRMTANPSVVDDVVRVYNWPFASDLKKIVALVKRVNS